MAKTADKTEMLKRRRLVAELLAQGAERSMGHSGIALELANPERPPHRRSTNFIANDEVPWSQVTISSDVKAIHDEWRKESGQAVADVKAEQLAMLIYLRDLCLTPDKRGRISMENRAEARHLTLAIGKLMGTDEEGVQVLEQVQAQMGLGVQRLRAHFADKPDLAREAINALTGRPRKDVN